MDDDYKDFRRNKPQQKLYKPGSGPLRRTGFSSDSRMDVHNVELVSNRDQGNYRSHFTNNENSRDQYKDPNLRNRKPEQPLYTPRSADSNTDIDRQSSAVARDDGSSQYSNRRMSNKQGKANSNSSGSYSRGSSRKDFQNKNGASNDLNYNRHRQVSEPRSTSPNHCAIENDNIDRNRDSRSMEISAGRQMAGAGGKPPSGRRNSAGYPSDLPRPKYINLENIPPRFRKQYLEKSGHYSYENVDQINRDQPVSFLQPNYNSNSNWSQTLPSRGRGRLRDTEGFDRDKFISSYLKNYEAQNSRRSTPSSSFLNLYDPNLIDNRNINENMCGSTSKQDFQKKNIDNVSKNGIVNNGNHIQSDHKDLKNHELDTQDDGKGASCSSSNLMDMKNLDWTEEVEMNIKLDDLNDTTVSFSQNLKISNPHEVKSAEARESKRSGRSRRRDKRSLSRGNKNDKKTDRNRKDSTSSIQQEPPNNHTNLKHLERERRDSYKSNRSSTIGNSRDDLDKWRSLRSFSREQSTEGRIVSQCNSRDTSTNRAISPRDSDRFRVPSAVSKSAMWLSANQQKKNNSSWASGRTPSLERGRHSPAPSIVSTGGEQGGGDNSQVSGGGSSIGGSGRSRRRRGGSRRKGRNSENTALPVNQPPGVTPAPTNINWREEILESKRHDQRDNHSETTNQRRRLNSSMSDKSHSDTSNSHPGLIILPQNSMPQLHNQGRGGSSETQKTLFDHQNPTKPIIVQTNPTKIDSRMERGVCESSIRSGYEASDAARAARHRALLQEVDRADAVLHAHRLRGPLALSDHWPDISETRKKLQNALQKLLMSDLKYCQSDNVEQHFWKILYYHFIEVLRNCLSQISPEDKPRIIKLLNTIIEEGNNFFDNLVQMLEKTYKFSTEDYINDNHVLPPKGLGYLGLALISVQKIYVFLGDLARYKEQVNGTNNFAKSKFWYTRAQQINPKNGRPYNQLAILAIYARRKLDAVYYYMRSLMSSNPFHSARESLLSLFDENRKKYEAAERKRRAAADCTRSAESSEEGTNPGSKPGAHGLRREVWIRPSGHRTTTIERDTTDDHITAMTSVELNKNFITSYLHVHGKLITKIGMESFHECASQMLRQFRALLHRQPLPTPAARLLQLTALNMFAVETTAASMKESSEGERSAWVEASLGVSLMMFGAMLERCCALLPEPPHSQQHADALLLLPAIKVWSDWMLCHSSLWNPPPMFDNFEIGSENDPWDWLAKLMNILEALDDKSLQLENEPKEGYLPVRLAEDSSLAGFTPLMYVEPAIGWVRAEPTLPPHAADHALRTRKLLFFGTEYLVGVEPPVLRLEYHTEEPPRYVSAVQPVLPHHPPLQHLTEDSEEDSGSGATSGPVSLSEGTEGCAEVADEATRRLLRRKEQLESRKATLEKRQKRMQEIVGGGWVSAELEVRPRWLVPDTNCFIDHLSLLQAVANQPYVLAVPLVVVSELEGLRKCSRVGDSARAALNWVWSGAAGGSVRLATMRGSLLASRAFTAERDAADVTRQTNDDRVLTTALSLQQNQATNTDVQLEDKQGGDGSSCVRRTREVVLLTDDRNLRVKAMVAEMPARDLQSFVQWAGLTTTQNETPAPSNAAGDASKLQQ